MSSTLFPRRRLAIAAFALMLPLEGARADEALRDPTEPPPVAARPEAADATPESNDLDLRAIFFAGDRRFAVINGRRVRETDRVAGGEVVAIGEDRVHLRRDGEILELVLVSPAFREARASESPAGADPIPPAAPTPGPDADPDRDPDEARGSDVQGAIR